MKATEELFLELDPRPEAAGKARRTLDERFGHRLPVDLRDRLARVISELINNSVIHGPGTPIRVRITAEPDGAVRGEVEDDGEGKVAISEIRRPGDGGLGLRMVAATVDRWGVYAGSTHVWFEMSASGGSPAEGTSSASD
jgi:anti-sigma regulatory factor (Ser/Thr protein kinase)